MKYYKSFFAASMLALLLAGFINYRITTMRRNYDAIVGESRRDAKGYDQQFIQLVNKFEHVLATRASFNYVGDNDFLNGKKRLRGPLPERKAHGGADSPFRVTAIMSNAAGKKNSALVTVGDRSFSVKPGDVINGKKITKITKRGIYMEVGSQKYFYDIHEGKILKAKNGAFQKQ